ncbi:MAG: glycoside hydrolase family 2, partial [Flavobacteriia bacterium]
MKNILLILFMFGIYLTASSQNQKTLLKDWRIQSSEKVGNKGELISSGNLNKKEWIRANVPTSVLNALMVNGAYKDIFIGKNIEKVDTKAFKKAWWYRTIFNIKDLDKTFLLKFEGINYSAEIWLNGKKIASEEEVVNPFRQYKFLVNKYLRKGDNILAVKVYPPKPGDYTIGFVDWNPAPPDNNMGIFRDVLLISNNGVSIEDPYIESSFKNGNYKETDLIFTTYLKNFDKDIKGDLKIKIGDISINKKITLKKGEYKKITLTSKDFKQLHLKNPKLWWPHTIGTPELYHAKVQFIANGKEIDSQEFDFGIREVSQYFTKEGHRGFKINGQKILIRGGGWVDNMMLNDTPDYIKAQLEYVKDMNLNTIRLEGFWGKDQTMYDLCDQMGILVMVGWSCHWEWEDYLGKPTDETYGGITSPKDIEMMSEAWKDQIVWLRNHPSIFAWSAGSDCIPKPELEKKYFDIFHKYDSTRAYLQSAKEWTSLAGPSGVKMRGPYAYVPPVYWYKDTLYGGAFGFNTETGPGAQVPPLESIKKMIPEKDLWPINDVWDFHCGRNEFNTLSRFTEALNKRYGEAKNVEDYAFKAQVLNYE